MARVELSCTGSVIGGRVGVIQTRYIRRGEGDPQEVENRTVKPPSFVPAAWAPMAAGWKAYFHGDAQAALVVRADDGDAEPMPISVFFRQGEGLSPADRAALARARGRVLDAGAGVGSISLALQERGLAVTALEVIPEGVAIMRERGVLDVREGRLEELPRNGAFDTILLLMNGTSLAGTLSGLPAFLETLEGLLAPGGQVLVDSTDLAGWESTEGASRGGAGPEWGPEDAYPGELQYQLEFEGRRGAPFPQLFVDPSTLEKIAEENGWKMESVWRGEEGEYLACLVRGRLA